MARTGLEEIEPSDQATNGKRRYFNSCLNGDKDALPLTFALLFSLTFPLSYFINVHSKAKFYQINGAMFSQKRKRNRFVCF